MSLDNTKRPLSHTVIMLLTLAVIGNWLVDFHQQRELTQHRHKRITGQQRSEALATLEQLTREIDSHLTQINRLLKIAKGANQDALNTVWDPYQTQMQDWTQNLPVHYDRVLKTIGKEQARLFHHPGDSPQRPRTVAGWLLRSHQAVRTLVGCIQADCPEADRARKIRQAQEALASLDKQARQFIDSAHKKISG